MVACWGAEQKGEDAYGACKGPRNDEKVVLEVHERNGEVVPFASEELWHEREFSRLCESKP